MTEAPNPIEHGWWIASRSAGVVALLAITFSVLLGLLMANGLPRRKGANRIMIGLHESTALAGLVALAIHGVTLLGDPWMNATLLKISVPFTIGYRPLWTSVGIIGGWIAIALGLSYYARRRIGTKRWRNAHRFTVLAWAMGLAHTLGSGTDANQVWLQAFMISTSTAIVFLFLRRTVPGDPKREAARRAATADALA